MDTLVEYAGPISTGKPYARLTLNSPHNRNALSTTLVSQLHQGLRDAADDAAVRAVVLSHTGNTFCAGADLSEGSAATDADPILGIHGPTGDIYLYAHTQFDIQGSYRIYKNLSFFAYGLNLSNEVFGFYQGSPSYPIQREFYKPTVAFGMRWSSSLE